MKKNKILVYVFTLFALLGCEPTVNVKNPAIPDQKENEDVPKETGCIDFESPFIVGTMYKGGNSGRIVYTSPDNIQMSTHFFHWTNGGTLGSAGIEIPPKLFAAGQAIFMNNINLGFDFTKVGFPVSKVAFQYLDLGGFENFSVNDQKVYIGELRKVSSTIAGVNIQILPNSQFPQNTSGKVIITGNIETVKIGGQELFIDNVCMGK